MLTHPHPQCKAQTFAIEPERHPNAPAQPCFLLTPFLLFSPHPYLFSHQRHRTHNSSAHHPQPLCHQLARRPRIRSRGCARARSASRGLREVGYASGAADSVCELDRVCEKERGGGGRGGKRQPQLCRKGFCFVETEKNLLFRRINIENWN